MPPKTGPKKSAKSEEDKKKDTGKNAKKGGDETSAGNADFTSLSNENTSSSKMAASNLIRGTSQSGTPLDDHLNRETGVSTSELSQHTDGIRDGGETGATTGDSLGGAQSETDVKYEEPILPNLIVLRFVIMNKNNKKLNLISFHQ